MKGKIVLRDPVGDIFRCPFEVPSDGKLHENLELRKDGERRPLKRGALKAAVRSDSQGKLECLLGYGDKKQPMVIFKFSNLIFGKPRTVTGYSFDKGKFVPWTGTFTEIKE